MQEEDNVFNLLYSRIGGELIDYSEEDLAAFNRYLSVSDLQRVRDSVLRLAAYLTPKDALAKHNEEVITGDRFDREDEPYEMIIVYLKEDLNLDEELAKSLGQNLGKLWEDWDVDSRNVSHSDTIKNKLQKDQRNRCSNCNVRLGNESNSTSFIHEDEYKPIHKYTHQQTKPELDHVEPLSHFGDNSINNFQVLCRFCNRGKSNKKAVDIVKQLEHATAPIEQIDRAHRRRMFFAATTDERECTRCGDTRSELTVRKENTSGCYIVPNLEPVCIKCIYE